MITLHGQESRAELGVLCMRRTLVVYVKAGCGVTGASEMGRVACPAVKAQVA